MAHEILMPKLGLTMTEGTVEEWKFKEGDTVKKGDILLSVATDKLTNDVESEVDGVLLNTKAIDFLDIGKRQSKFLSTIAGADNILAIQGKPCGFIQYIQRIQQAFHSCSTPFWDKIRSRTQ